MLRSLLPGICLLLPLASHGSELSEEMRRCQAQEDAAARLSCYDALAAAIVTPMPTPAPQAEAKPASEVASEAETAGSAAGDEAAGQQDRGAEATAAVERTEVEGVTAASDMDKVAGTAAVAATGTNVTSDDQQAEAGFGRTQEKTETPDSMLAVISEIDTTAYGKLVLSFTNGQIWRQLDSRRTTLRPGDEVRISSAMSGSFLLSKSSGGTSIRVRRIDG